MNRSIFKLVRNWAFHFLLIATIALSSQLLNAINYRYLSPEDIRLSFNWHILDLLVMGVFLLLTELNYRYVFKKYNWLIFGLSCALVSIISLLLLMLLYPNRSTVMLAAIRPGLLATGYAFTYAVLRDYLHHIRHKKDTQLQQSKNELDALKAQLNPHFLFNSLNYLYGTALNENAPNTADGIDTLSEMMRYTISGIHENFVPLENELKFIERYLLLQQARLPKNDNIKVGVNIGPAPQSLQIAPLLLLPFIENAFKYGVSNNEPSFVKINIAVTGSQLTMEIHNSIITTPIEIKGNNTGIRNTLKRLELLYADNYNLEHVRSLSEYKVLLTLNLTS